MTLEEHIQKLVGVTVDGIIGKKTLAGISQALGCGEGIKAIQGAVGVRADGIMGLETKKAVLAHLGGDATASAPAWPTQAEVRGGSSVFGSWKRAEENLVNIVPAYPLLYDGKPVKSIRVHKVVAPYVEKIFQEVLAAYGLEKIHALGLDQYGGSYNARNTAGGSTMSMHAWGIALDFAPGTNALKQNKTTATLARPECAKWWEIWEKYGAVSLGREKDYDWMHVQFARLK